MKIKLRVLLVSFFILYFTSLLNAQQPVFSKVYYDNTGSAQAYSIVETYDNNYIITGERNNNGLVLKIDSTGNIIWSKKIDSDNNTSLNNVILTNDSCFVIAGQCKNSVNATTDIFYMKMNANGDTIWTRSIDMGNNEYFSSIQQTNDNGFILSGYTNQYLTTPHGIMVIVKLDSIGNILWTKKITLGNYNNNAYAAKQTKDGGYVVIGYLENYINSTFDIRACLIRLSSDGTILWARNNDSNNIMGYDVIVNDNNMTCYLKSTNSDNLIIMNTDLSGNVLWSKIFYLNINSVSFTKLRSTSDGGYIVAYGDPRIGMLLKIDSLGNVLWANRLYLFTTDAIESSDKGFVVIGNGPIISAKIDPDFNPQIGIIKTDSLGSSSACVDQSWFTAATYNLNFISVSGTTATGGTMNFIHPVTSNDTLSIYSGCVSMSSSIYESKASENTLIVYPNPSNGIFDIDIKYTENITKLEIFNAIGEKIYQSSEPTILQQSLDLSFEPDGIYYLQLTSSENKYSQKIIIHH